MGQVRIQLDDGPVGSCAAQALPVWESKGYRVVDVENRRKKAPTNEGVVEHEATDLEVAGLILKAARGGVELFNPGDHTVEDVEAHLASADDAEFARVIVAEAVGKNRKTIADLNVPAQTPGPVGPGEASTAGANNAENQAGGASVTSPTV